MLEHVSRRERHRRSVPNTRRRDPAVQDRNPSNPAGHVGPRVSEGSGDGNGVDRDDLEFDDEAKLMAALKARNPFCLGLLFQRYSRPVLDLALRILRDHSEAEEVVQEVFLYIYERPHLFDAAKGSARNWIMRIAASRALDKRLYLARRGFYAAVNCRSLDDTLPSTRNVESEMNSRLNRRHLEQALKVLTASQRETIECFYFDDLELREISDRLGEPLGNVRHHLYRGLARLRKSTLLGNL